MWKVLFGFSSLLCLIVIVFILIKMAREVILLSTATLPKGGGWGGGAQNLVAQVNSLVILVYTTLPPHQNGECVYMCYVNV